MTDKQPFEGLATREEIEAAFDRWLRFEEPARLQRDPLFQAYMNLEYMQDLEGVLHGYHKNIGNFTMTAEEILKIYIQLFVTAEKYKMLLQKAIPSYKD